MNINITEERYRELIAKEVAYEMLRLDSEENYWTSMEKAMHLAVDALKEKKVEEVEK